MTAGLADEPGLDVAEGVARAVAGGYPGNGPGIVYAVLVGIHADGEVEHTTLPGFVAEAILAPERARRAAASGGGG